MNELYDILKDSRSVVFFGGAGVSTESGIPDFRSTDGIYNQKYDYPPEVILSHSFFMANTAEFYRFYREKMIYLNAKPNMAHIFLAELEKKGTLKAVVTQNIDGLHQMAGANRVYELHGSVHRNYCMRCRRFYPIETIIDSEGVPRCSCGGIIKPDVVLYEEGLDGATIQNSVEAIASADTLIIGGTSLNVYPAASLITVFKGKHIVVINKSATNADRTARLTIRRPIGEVFAELRPLLL